MDLFELLDTAPDVLIADSFVITNDKIKKYDKIVCSISGGSDSDIMLDMCTKLDTNKKISYVWFDTGLEYQATKDHLRYLENKYGITIGRIKAIMTEKKYMENRSAKQYNKKQDGSQIVREYRAISRKKVIANIWEYSVGLNNSTNDKIAFSHPAIFPEKLAEDHILSWSNPGDIILDPFMGSGTTAKMALLHNRYYIGYEISKEYCDIAEERLCTL